MPDRDEQEWQQDDGSNVRYTREQNSDRPEERPLADQDDTYRYGEGWDGEAETGVQGHDDKNMERFLRSENMEGVGDPYAPDVTQKHDWKPDDPNNSRRPPDGRRPEKSISEEAKQRLFDDHRVDASNIYVDVDRGGQVRLWGAVASADEKSAAEEIVRGVPGVSEVNNELQIMQNKPLHTGGPDEQKRPE